MYKIKLCINKRHRLENIEIKLFGLLLTLSFFYCVALQNLQRICFFLFVNRYIKSVYAFFSKNRRNILVPKLFSFAIYFSSFASHLALVDVLQVALVT